MVYKKRMSLTLFFTVAFIGSFFYYYFFCDCVVYGNHGSKDGRFYSPNRKYYVVGYISRFRSDFDLEPVGLAKLHFSDGALLSARHVLLDAQAGPVWAGSACEGNRSRNWIIYVTSEERLSWSYQLPGPPGRFEPLPGCQDETVTQ